MAIPFDDYCQMNILECMKKDDFLSAHCWAEMWGNVKEEQRNGNEEPANPPSH